MALERMPQWLLQMDCIVVPPPLLAYIEHAAIVQVTHNLLHCPFGDTYVCRHIAQARFPVAGKADQNVAVIAE